MVLVSVDDHVVEPPDLFAGRLPAKYADLAPQFITNEDGTNAWLYEGQVLPNVALNAVAGRPREEYGLEPTSFDQLRPGCYDIDERVKDMDANGVLGSLCFPSFPQFCGQLFARTEDKDVALAMIRAYNDWHIDEWCGTHPGRFIPCPLPAIWDPEVHGRRGATDGGQGRPRGDLLGEPVQARAGPASTRDHWDPFWRACSEEAGGGVHAHRLVLRARDHLAGRPDGLPDHPDPDEHRARPPPTWCGRRCCASSPISRWRCPRAASAGFRTSSSASTTTTTATTLWTGQDFGDELPSQVFNRNVLTCFIDDRFGVASREFLEMDNVMWECDYPHSDSTWPTAPETLAESLDGVSDYDIDRITHLNAMRHFHYDPFTALGGKENCTVGSLRAQAVGPRRVHPLPGPGRHGQAGHPAGRPRRPPPRRP